MGSVLKIAGLQMLVGQDVAENEQRILSGIERAAADGADLLATPEGALSGYRAGFDHDELVAALDRVETAARESGIGLAL